VFSELSRTDAELLVCFGASPFQSPQSRGSKLPAASGPDFKARSIDTSGPIEVEAEYRITSGWR
jgi:hypothetical protein